MTAPIQGLEYTGERMIPEATDGVTFWEHIYRYRFAAPLVRGKRVLDIACGEGYGTHALKLAGASQVIGVDVSEQACQHARAKYGVDARQGDARAIPLPPASVDVVVSFETIEHVPEPDAFLDECARVLVPGGTLVISTPDGEVYLDGQHTNQFHCSEMPEREFVAKLEARFRGVKLFSQRLQAARRWSAGSLSAESSPWRGIRGFRRLAATICPLSNLGAINASGGRRGAPEAEILAAESRASMLFNPFVVRPRPRTGGDRSIYLIATAVRS
jgi:2-polyprenyl-3-methyl-5-hydroxy-6-metoxy-1,4-benzoquinol methylase